MTARIAKDLLGTLVGSEEDGCTESIADEVKPIATVQSVDTVLADQLLRGPVCTILDRVRKRLIRHAVHLASDLSMQFGQLERT